MEEIQDVIESALMEEGYGEIAKSYILYRENRSQVRFAKSALGLKDDLKLPVNAVEVLKRRYLLKDEAAADRRDAQRAVPPRGPSRRPGRGQLRLGSGDRRGGRRVLSDDAQPRVHAQLADPDERRHARWASSPPASSFRWRTPSKASSRPWPTWRGSTRPGGGTGFDFSRLRPRGDLVGSTKGHASGPLSFMGIFDKATEVIVQGGRRRGANMGVLRCDHPDVIDFIEAKVGSNAFRNFNLSVGVTDKFMRAVANNRPFDLVNPRTGKSVRQLGARSLFDLIVNAAWRTGDPGLIFLDHVNRRNPTPAARPDRGDQSLRRGAAAAVRELHPGLDQPRQDDQGRGTGGAVGRAAVDWDKLGTESTGASGSSMT